MSSLSEYDSASYPGFSGQPISQAKNMASFKSKGERRLHFMLGNNGNLTRASGRRQAQAPQVPSVVPLQCLRHHFMPSSYDFTASAVRGHCQYAPSERLCGIAYSVTSLYDCSRLVTPPLTNHLGQDHILQRLMTMPPMKIASRFAEDRIQSKNQGGLKPAPLS